MNGFISILNCYLKNLFCQRNIIAAQVLLDPYQNILESELSHCPLGEAVTFYYYRGRLALYTEDYDSALDHFTKALNLCDRTHKRNIAYGRSCAWSVDGCCFSSFP